MSLFGGSKQKQEVDMTTTSSVDPWGRASGGLDQAMGWADRAVGGPAWSPYGGQQVAGFNPMQQQAFNAAQGWFGNQGTQGANALFGYGMGSLQGGQGASDYYGRVLGQDPMAQAAQYANSPYMDQMVQAAGRDTARSLYEGALPAITSASAGSGNLGSSRRGAQEAIAERGANERIGDISASLRGNAYSQMLNNVMSQQQNAAGALQNQANMGMGALTGAQNMYSGAYGNMLGMGNQQQANQQQLLDAQMRNYYMGQQMPVQQAAAMQGLYLNPAQMFGQQTNRQTGTTTTSNSGPGGLAGALNMAGQLGGAALMGGMNPFAGIGSAVGGLFGGSNAQMNPGGWNNAMSNINLFG